MRVRGQRHWRGTRRQLLEREWIVHQQQSRLVVWDLRKRGLDVGRPGGPLIQTRDVQPLRKRLRLGARRSERDRLVSQDRDTCRAQHLGQLIGDRRQLQRIRAPHRVVVVPQHGDRGNSRRGHRLQQ